MHRSRVNEGWGSLAKQQPFQAWGSICASNQVRKRVNERGAEFDSMRLLPGLCGCSGKKKRRRDGREGERRGGEMPSFVMSTSLAFSD